MIFGEKLSDGLETKRSWSPRRAAIVVPIAVAIFAIGGSHLWLQHGPHAAQRADNGRRQAATSTSSQAPAQTPGTAIQTDPSHPGATEEELKAIARQHLEEVVAEARIPRSATTHPSQAASSTPDYAFIDKLISAIRTRMLRDVKRASWGAALQIDGIVDGASVFVDPSTGCQYLLVGSAMSPRMSPAGAQVCDADDTIDAVRAAVKSGAKTAN